MAIKKQEFYEGAALHLLARSGGLNKIRYESPQFVVNGNVLLHLKYSTKNRSPWGFTFVPEEQLLLAERAATRRLFLGLVCGADGVVAVQYEAYREIAAPRDTSIHVACYRRHGEHYEVNGPDGSLGRKIPPSMWQRILESEEQ